MCWDSNLFSLGRSSNVESKIVCCSASFCLNRSYFRLDRSAVSIENSMLRTETMGSDGGIVIICEYKITYANIDFVTGGVSGEWKKREDDFKEYVGGLHVATQDYSLLIESTSSPVAGSLLSIMIGVPPPLKYRNRNLT